MSDGAGDPASAEPLGVGGVPGVSDGEAVGVGEASGSIEKATLVRSTASHPNPVGSPSRTHAVAVARVATRSQRTSAGANSDARGPRARATKAAPLSGQIVRTEGWSPLVPLIRPKSSTVKRRWASASAERGAPAASKTPKTYSPAARGSASRSHLRATRWTSSAVGYAAASITEPSAVAVWMVAASVSGGVGEASGAASAAVAETTPISTSTTATRAKRRNCGAAARRPDATSPADGRRAARDGGNGEEVTIGRASSGVGSKG